MMSSGADSGRGVSRITLYKGTQRASAGFFLFHSKNNSSSRTSPCLSRQAVEILPPSRHPCAGRDPVQRSYLLNTIFRIPIQRDSCMRRKDGVFKERRSARGETKNKDIKYDKMKLWITLLETIVLFLFEERKQIIRWYIRWLTL